MFFLLAIFTSFFATSIFLIVIITCLATKKLRKLRVIQKEKDNRFSIGLFHPYCNAGGGGERVLWIGLKALIQTYPNAHFVIYTGDTDASPKEILKKMKSTFNIDLGPDTSYTLDFIYLHKRGWVEASKFPYFTLLGQSIGSIILGFEALFKFVPDVYIDTMGYAFTLPIFKYIGGCKVGCYIHYPTISTDMIKRISYRTETYNNDGRIARSPFRSMMKLIYYNIFAKLYSWSGRFSTDIAMVNSSWTEDHINYLWAIPSRTFKVYPPCDVEEFKGIQRKEENEEGANLLAEDEIRILSISQFRPEKDHPLQIRALFQLRQILKENLWEKIRLVLVGSCRNAEDAVRVQDLKDLSMHLSLEDHVIFKTNVSFEELKEEMAQGAIGIHTMWNEHFGIGIVESMAAGLIMVANRSGGPLMDIVTENADGHQNGFLAQDENDYAYTIKRILYFTPQSRNLIRNQAKASVDRFSEKQFINGFLEATQSLFKNLTK